MATEDDKSKSRPRRNRVTSYAQSPADLPLARREELIEEERSRLMRAVSLLDGVLLALEAADEDGGGATDGPHCPTLIEMARELVNESINGMDSVNLIRVANAKGVCEPYIPYGAKEIIEDRPSMAEEKLAH